jgi:hypothetical protein
MENCRVESIFVEDEELEGDVTRVCTRVYTRDGASPVETPVLSAMHIELEVVPHAY